MIARFASLLSNGITKKSDKGNLLPLPRLIVVVPEDDILKTLGEDVLTDEESIGIPIKRLLNFVMTEYSRAVSTFKENLPAKCNRDGYPFFLWIQLPMHENFSNNSARFRFNKCLEECAKMHSNVYTLQLQKVWDPRDAGLFANRFTNEGYRSYWEAIDKTVRFFDSVILKKNEKKKVQKKEFNSQKERFRWRNPEINQKFADTGVFRKLPAPPPRH